VESIECGVDSFVYASSSSVYGNHASTILSENLRYMCPISFYGATKLTNEILANALSATSPTKFLGMRFFTVYGPWGRPDMAYLKLISSGLNNKTFALFGDGSKKRDFTYIKDVVNSIYDLTVELMHKSGKYSDIVNIGGGNPVSMDSLISTIENELKTKIQIAKSPDAMGDVNATYASTEYLENLIGSRKFVEINEGIKETINWAREYNGENQLDKWV
jgi:UDP-glucuronate 4-epimerase